MPGGTPRAHLVCKPTTNLPRTLFSRFSAPIIRPTGDGGRWPVDLLSSGPRVEGEYFWTW
ncbi:MAG: hypothetical protein FD130_1410 [Halothiobacillaceae bacterium]|nr:MAG: hypothetical protein FD130_1410 [Halothiobacillaceae bacterium]